ncbi:MAG TPA: MFS transporter [Acidobacteriaceae bacterium]
MLKVRHAKRWWMAALVFAATVVNYLDRQTLSVAAPVLREQFHMSDTGYSRVVSAFLLAYTVMNGVSGPLIDRLGTRVGYALCMAWWSLASMLHALARGTVSLAVCRFLLGMGEAGNWPAGVKVVAEWFPEQERALASGFFNSGSSVGAILAPPLIAWMILRHGWRSAFVVTGLVGAVWLAVWLSIYKMPTAESATAQQSTTAARVHRPVAKLFRTRFVWGFTVAKAFIDPVWYFYIFWFPEYLKEVRHFSLAQIGALAWIPFVIAGLGNLLGGLVGALLLRWGVSPAIAGKLASTLFILCMLAAIPAVYAHSPFVSMGFVSLAMMGYTGTLANMLAFPSSVFPKELVGSVYGIASMGAGFGGMVTTLIAGWAIDHFSYIPVFIGFGLLPLIGALLIWTLLGPLSKQAFWDQA